MCVYGSSSAHKVLSLKLSEDVKKKINHIKWRLGNENEQKASVRMHQEWILKNVRKNGQKGWKECSSFCSESEQIQ